MSLKDRVAQLNQMWGLEEQDQVRETELRELYTGRNIKLQQITFKVGPPRNYDPFLIS